MNSDILFVLKGNSIHEAAKQMDNHSVGLLLVTDLTKLIGVISERDILKRVVSKGLDPKKVTVSDVMTSNPITVTTDEDIRNQAIEEVEDKLGEYNIEGDITETEMYNHARKEIIKAFNGESLSGL